MNQKRLLASGVSLAASAIFILGCAARVYKPGSPRASVEVINVVIDDSQGGNEDGKLNPGETVKLFLTIKTTDKKALRASKAALFTNQRGINIIQKTAEFLAMAPEQKASSSLGFVVSVDRNVSATSVAFYLEAFSGTNFRATFSVNISKALVTSSASDAAIEVVSVAINDAQGGNNDGKLNPNETVGLLLQIKNIGQVNIPASEGRIFSNQHGIHIVDSTAAIPAISIGKTVSASEEFVIMVDSSATDESAAFLLTLNTADSGRVAQTIFVVTITYTIYACVDTCALIEGQGTTYDTLLA